MRYWLLAMGIGAMTPLTGCGGAAAGDTAEATGPQATFMAGLRDKCDRAYRGKLVAGDNRELTGKELVLAIGPCDADGDVTLALHANIGPLQVSREEEVWDRSRTMTLSQNGEALALKLGDHKQDGSAGPMQGIKANAAAPGSESRQSFAIAGAQEPLVIESSAEAVLLTIPTTEAAEGFRAEFESSDRAATPPPTWGQGGG